ncbi:MAG: bifunctional DNA-formamidopyrimidine glycosylase/DNA-(apurinic or apyrimidinic site) lyase [Phenylobacterium sp.]|jgi:formamidopyrimidine-DNA glycosylase|uniref:bifunctional DNA-formamidopyrimidine glycosylase/DNA-(apurinic or apyrimidinic site) lyase n=1 Tax=Phenylobacterium sp. TaxID=1871053 RepID=UPI002A36448F|nr:bifunctional DNA-formamidopyrimidine glycosylase/DNA-(apurinic or apyrimidinic site) lyase [Phenylobacterium sp.]MDX9998606.1 bifunctional DNA-formamidopyrimidine glycosylase/DNA-(apurinic or apyrimidinic site) lyase [Phenylobacterium sp.]
MPELPEVETVRRGLEPVLAGARLVRVEARRPDLRFPLPDGFVQRLTGASVLRLERRAKYLLAPLGVGDTLVMHLGMTGRFEIARPEGSERPGEFHYAPDPDPKHAHVVFETEAGARITYYDPRRFGYMALVETALLALHPWFAGLGPEPLSPAFDADHLARAFAGRRQGPKTLLLDQRVVAGLGNIYVCEALHRARISPFRPAGRISRPRLERLVQAVREVLEEAIAAGGSTISDYAAADGALGYFQHSFRVYDREGRPCPNPGCDGVIARKVQAGRSTFYCPRCQR